MNQKGNFLPALGILAIILIVGIGAYYFGTQRSTSSKEISENLNNSENNQKTASPTASATNNPNLQTYQSKRCNFSVGYPKDWKAKDTPLVSGTDDPDYLYGCVDIQAPDFSVGLDNVSGFYVSINKTNLGASFNGVKINSLEDYIKAHESMVQPAMTVKNRVSTSYGNKQGIEYDTFGREEQRAFIFLNNNQIFKVIWPKNYQGNSNNQLSDIISSIQF